MSDIEYPENSLDRQEPVSPEFNNAANENKQEEVSEQDQGSAMIQEEMPANDMQPPEELRQDVDREVFNDRLSSEYDQAADRNAEAKEAYLDELADSMGYGDDQERGQENDRGNDYEMSP